MSLPQSFVRQFLVQDYHVIQEDAARQRNAPADVDFELGDSAHTFLPCPPC